MSYRIAVALLAVCLLAGVFGTSPIKAVCYPATPALVTIVSQLADCMLSAVRVHLQQQGLMLGAS
jgi:hypothetical protein